VEAGSAPADDLKGRKTDVALASVVSPQWVISCQAAFDPKRTFPPGLKIEEPNCRIVHDRSAAWWSLVEPEPTRSLDPSFRCTGRGAVLLRDMINLIKRQGCSQGVLPDRRLESEPAVRWGCPRDRAEDFTTMPVEDYLGPSFRGVC